jgi:hypothetical protein
MVKEKANDKDTEKVKTKNTSNDNDNDKDKEKKKNKNCGKTVSHVVNVSNMNWRKTKNKD